MSKNLARISYVLALAGLKNSGGGGGGGTGDSETPYEYMLKNGFTGTESQFITAWKASLNPVPFKDQFYSYLVSIGYNKEDMVQADKYIASLVNGEIKPVESFYDSMKKLVPSMTEPDINVVMTDLLTGKLTSKELYKMLTDKGYNKTQEDMQSTLYTLFTTEILTPYTYLTNTLNETSVTEEEFNTQYIKLAKGKLDKQDIYNYLLANGMDSSITQATVDEWLIKLVSGDLDGQTPYDYAKTLGTTQTKEDFDYQYFTLLCKYLVDGGSANKTAGGDSFPGPWTPSPASGVSLYDMYVTELGYQGTQEELYSQLQKVAYTLLASGGDSSNDETHTGSNTFPADIPDIEPHECYVSEITGGNADATNGGMEIFDGEYNGRPYASDSLYATMVQQGYKYSQEQLSDQLNELMNYNTPDTVIVDGGGSSTMDAEQEYTGELPEVRNAVLQYMVDELGFQDTPENVENFNQRFGEFVNGNIVGNVDGNA